MFRTVPLSTIRSLFTVHSAMVYVIQVCRQLSSRTIHKLLMWTDELSKTCSVSWQNKFVKLVHLVGFTTKRLHYYLTAYLILYACTYTPPCSKCTYSVVQWEIQRTCHHWRWRHVHCATVHMFKLGDFPCTRLQVVTAFTNAGFYMFLKMQMAQLTEFIGKKQLQLERMCWQNSLEQGSKRKS